MVSSIKVCFIYTYIYEFYVSKSLQQKLNNVGNQNQNDFCLCFV